MEVDTTEMKQSFSTQGDKTKTNYINMYKRLRPLLENDVKDSTADEIINAIRGYETTANSRRSMLNVVYVIFKHFDKSTLPLVNYRDDLAGDAFDESRVKDTAIKEKEYTLKQITDYMNDAFVNGDYLKFVINYLLLNYQTRNQDLDLIITTDKKELNDTDNFILLREGSCDYIRNHYKTADTYGAKKHLIRNKNFVLACSMLLNGEKTKFLLQGNGGRVSDGYLNGIISRNTMDNLGTSKYFKIISTSKKNIEKLSSNRGTNPNTIVGSYNLNKKINLKKNYKLKVTE
jgi:hypothetical protein